MPVKNPIDCFKKYGVKDLSNQLQKRIEEGANPYEAAREIILAEHRRLHDTVNDIRTVGKLKKEPYIEPKDISQQLKKLKEKPSVSVQMPGEVKKPEIVEPQTTEKQKPIIVYHGTSYDIDKPTIDKYGQVHETGGMLGKAVYFTPSKTEADYFADLSLNKNKGGKKKILEGEISPKKMISVTELLLNAPKDVIDKWVSEGSGKISKSNISSKEIKEYANLPQSEKSLTSWAANIGDISRLAELNGNDAVYWGYEKGKPNEIAIINEDLFQPKIAETTTPTAPQAEAAETTVSKLESSKNTVSGIKLNGSPRKIINDLKGRKGDNAIHAEIFQRNGYNVFIYNNNKILVNKTFKTHEEAKKYLNDWSAENGKDNQEKYDYGTITDIANPPYRQEITGELPKDFIDKNKAVEQPLQEPAKTTVSDAEALPVAYGKAETKVQPEISGKTKVSDSAKQLADKVRSLKINLSKLGDGGLQSNIAGIPAALWNAAIDTIALAIEGGATLAQAVQKAIKKHNLDKQKGFNQKEFISKLEQASGEKLLEEPPPGEPPPTSSGGIYVERPATELSFRGLQDVANEFGYEDVKSRDRVSDLQERQNAINTSKKWAEKGEYEKNVNNLLSEIEKRERVPTAEQRIILEMYLANEKQKLRDIADKSSTEFDKQLQKVKRVKEVGNIARSEAGAALRVNEGRSLPHPINDYADAMTAMAEANSVEVLTDAQKAEVEKLVTTYEQRSKEAEAKVLAMEQRMMEIEAAKEVGQIRQYKKAAKKRTAEQLKQERENILNSLKEKWANAGKDVLSSDIPFRKQIAAIAPDVKKLVANLLDSGVNELSQIIDNIHAAISGFIPDVGKDDIRDIIGGKYNRKQKRSELAKKVADLKTEVNLIDRLQDLLKGEEPKTEKRKIERNQKIQELRRQIKDLSGFESELAKAADELISQKQKEAKKLDKDLSKIEKEEDAAEERAKKEEEAKLERERKEAERERVRLKKEFEKEKNREEKEKLKAAVQEAKMAEKMLSYKLPGERKLEEFKNRAQKAEQDIRAKIEAGDFEKEDKPTSVFDSKDLKEAFPIQYREMLDAIAAKEDAQRDYDIAVYKAEQAKRGKVRKVIDWGRAVIATTKALKSGIDDSAVMMQNVVAMVSHPRSAVKALREHALDAVSEKRFRRSLTEIHNSPLWDLIEKSGLDITDPQSLKEQNKEEVFDKNLLNKDFKIGGKKFNIGKYVTRPFERAFTSLGNAMRVNMFARITEKWADEGKTFETNPEDYKALATLLNTETGRGKLHTQIERASQLITAGIWSPRLMSSRLNMLGVSDVLLPFVGGKGYYAGLSPKIRQMAIADMVKFIGAGISLMAFAAFRGADVDDDPESPTFGTIQVGDKKYNTWGGFTPYVKTFVQGATGKRNIRGERKDVARSKILFSFFRSRLTPAAGVTTNLLTGRDFANRPITAEGEIMNLMAPLSVMGIIDGLKKDGIVGLLNQGLPSFVGVGVSDERDFEPENKNQERKQNKPKGKERKD